MDTMSLKLHELLLCCRGLEHEKATERKKEVERFRRLVCVPEVVELLDRQSDSSVSRGSKQLSWHAVFRFLQRYVQRETELLQSGKANVSASTQSSRQKKQQEIGSLMKYFIRCANQRGARLKCCDLLGHVLEVLQGRFSCAAYGEDYSSVLLKNVLCVHKYWCEMSAAQWQSLLDLYCRHFTSKTKAINRVQVSRIILTLVYGCCVQTEGSTHTLFCFFSSALKDCRAESQRVLENLVSALNVFLRSVLLSSRRRVCAVGENILSSLLCVLTEMRPSSLLKEELVKFFSLQLCVHHPGGAKTPESGAHAEDWQRWQCQLELLYDALMGEIAQIGSRGKYAGGNRPVAVQQNLIQLMADLCHQLFRHGAQEVTSSLGGDGPQSSKRRRVEPPLTWETIRSKLQPHHTDFDIIPWLQVTAALLSQYPSILPAEELVALLSLLCQLQGGRGGGERGPYVWLCVRTVARCHRKGACGAELDALWLRVWSLGLRGVCSAPCLELLRVMLCQALVPVEGEFWKLFTGSVCKPSAVCVLSLAQALLKSSVRPGLREAIMDWLLMSETEESGRPHLISSAFPLELVSRLLVCLTLKHSAEGLSVLMDGLTLDSPAVLCEWSESLREAASLFLRFSFDDTHQEREEEDEGEGRARRTFSAIPALRDKLDNSLLSVAEQLLYCCSETPVSVLHPCVLRCVSLLSGVLAACVCVGLLTEQQACHSTLFQKATALFHEFGSYVSVAKNRLAEQDSVPAIRSASLLCCQHLSRGEKEDDFSRVSRRLFLKSLPGKMLHDLCDVSGQLLSSCSKKEASLWLREDEDMDTTASEEREEPHVAFSEEHADSLQSSGMSRTLSRDLLSEPDLCFLSVLDFLSLCAASPHHGFSFKPLDVQHKLLKLLDQADFSQPPHLHMYLCMLKQLPADASSLAADEFDALLKPLPDVCSLHRHDQDVCVALLAALLPSIRALRPQEELSHARGALLKVMSGFCILGNSGKCVSSVRAALLHCLLALLQVDPLCEWAVLEVKGEELPVSTALCSYLTDDHHRVCMLTSLSLESLFYKESSMLPLRNQQTAFENIYLKAQEGLRRLKSCAEEDSPDQTFNRQATLLKSLTVVMCCSPVCEKQALFALFQAHKENAISQRLLGKVLRRVSLLLGYKDSESLMTSHLYYLTSEWLNQKQCDPSYTLQAFPYTLLGFSSLEQFYRSCCHVLVPHLVFLKDLPEVRSMADCLAQDWRQLLALCFPKIMVNILPHFALPERDALVAQQRENAHHVYSLLKDSACLGKQQIDSLICHNLAEIVVELLLTLHETAAEEESDLRGFTGELDPAPNPPCFSSYAIKATLDYLSRCHSSSRRTLVSILCDTPMSIQKILVAIAQKGSETTSTYEKHRVLMMFHLFTGLLLAQLKDGLGEAWPFVLRDVIYTLVHHINSSSSCRRDEVSARSLSLCCDLLSRVCRTTLEICEDALQSHLQVIVGTLTSQVLERSATSQQVLALLRFLVIENPQSKMLRRSIARLEPFPDRPVFREFRAAQQALKYGSGAFSLRQEIEHFLSVASCDSWPLARLEGLKDLRRQLHRNKAQIGRLLQECHADPASCVLVKLVLNLLQLCKVAVNNPSGRDVLEAVGECLGELGPVDLASIALHYGKDQLYVRAAALFPQAPLQWIYISLSCMDAALTHHSVAVRQAAGVCLRNIFSTPAGVDFWNAHKKDLQKGAKDLKLGTMMEHLSPFCTGKRRDLSVTSVTSVTRDLLDRPELWAPPPAGHGEWLKSLCLTLLDSGGVRHEALLLTRPLCEVKPDFCQKMLPLFIHNILLEDEDGSARALLSSRLRGFFQRARRSHAPSTAPPSGGAAREDLASLRCMLAVVDHLRHQSRPLEHGSAECGTVCHSNFWLDLDFLDVAGAAQLCSAHFTALLYCEIHVDRIRSEAEQRTSAGAARRITFDRDAEVLSGGGALQDILTEVYSRIGEPDGLYGCGRDAFITPLTRIRTYEHEAMWEKALVSYDLHSSLPHVTRQMGIVEGLQKSGLCSILGTYLRGLEKEGTEWSPELLELRFQAAWRNTQWECELPERKEKAKPGINESVFTALQALRNREFAVFEETLSHARRLELAELCRGRLEAVSSLRPVLCNLQKISELHTAQQLFLRPVSASSLSEVFQKWRQHSQLLSHSEFSAVEPVLALRSSVLQTLLSCQPHPERETLLLTEFSSHLMELCKLARSARHTQLAERTVFLMKQRGQGLEEWAWRLEEAQVFWVKREQELALGLLRQIIHALQDLVLVNPAVLWLYSKCLRLCGSWLAESCLESPAVILDQYLEKAVEVIEECSGRPDDKLQAQKTQAFFALARFSDAQYQSIKNYMKSPEFENKQGLLEKAKEEVQLMKQRRVSSNRYTVKVERELELDVLALQNLKTDRNRFLIKALENYVRCLALGEEQDTGVFRLASLWLENAELGPVNQAVKDGVKNIPSHKFLPLMYQLAARMASSESQAESFQQVLHQLMARCSLQHPHHTLFIILALVNANRDEDFTRPASKRRTPLSPLDLERSDVARRIIEEVRKSRSRMVKDMESLCDAYIALAYLNAKCHKSEKRNIPIPSTQPIVKIQDLEDVVVPTLDIKVDPSGRYKDLVTVQSFKPYFLLAGGVNLPKIVECVGSDGVSRRQLVKGQDDLRQDAVMQQVFHMCSTLLQRNTETRKRKLNIRRYKVVPFSQRSGVLEWCSGTVPIGDLLTDAHSGLHHRFRPHDWTSMTCRRRMMEAQKMGMDGAKLQLYSEVCEHFRPVFRYFCMERFLDPAVWLEKRLAYTRSVATSSIVGYIVGLGDRHVQNILIDEQSAELVHIDLGVAFEQGRVLPTPETVPFRLTRDIVDGMGVCGVEGVFRRCCEKTMEVMRSSQEALLTIVEVLLYDPLFDWTMNPLKAFQLQQHEEQTEMTSTPAPEEESTHRKSSDSQSFNKVAERVLLRLQEKLKGVEGGSVLSVSGQVNLLIQQAVDPKNLSRLFPGWQAWV